MRREEVALSTTAQEGYAPVTGPALGCLWEEEEKLGFPLPWVGQSGEGRGALLSLPLGEPWEDKPFCKQDPPVVSSWVHPTIPILRSHKMPQHPQINKLYKHSFTPTGRLGK